MGALGARYDYALVDLDGVVWLGGRVLEENVEGLRRLASMGVRLVFVTNNSTRTRGFYASRLRSLGLPACRECVVTSGSAAAEWLRGRLGEGALVYPLGEEGLAAELALAGLEVATADAARRGMVDAVVVGLDRGLSYWKLDAALRAVRAGALFVAANEDHVIPVEDGVSPGAGAIVAALRASLGRGPDFTAGKPNPWMAEVARRAAGVGGRGIVIGDRLDTDVELARRAGLDSLLVYTGIARPGEGEGAATYTAPSVLAALPLLQG